MKTSGETTVRSALRGSVGSGGRLRSGIGTGSAYRSVFGSTDAGHSSDRISTFRKYISAASISSAIRPRVIGRGEPGFAGSSKRMLSPLVDHVAVQDVNRRGPSRSPRSCSSPQPRSRPASVSGSRCHVRPERATGRLASGLGKWLPRRSPVLGSIQVSTAKP